MKSLQSLSDSGLVWRADKPSFENRASIEFDRSTGFSKLNKALLTNGWPEQCLLELLLPQPASGELSLFLPWLGKAAQQTDKKIAFIAPPFLPSLSALLAYGIKPQQIWLLSPNNLKEQLWAQQQCLTEGQCLAVFMWHDEKTSDTTLRKLQLAAKQGECLGISVRPLTVQAMSSPAPYRILLKPMQERLVELTVLKRRGGWAASPFGVNLDEPLRQTQHSKITSLI